MIKSLSNKLYLKKQLYGLSMKQKTEILEHLNFFNKIISELLTVDVKIDEENKALILHSLLPESYDHIVTVMLYDKEILKVTLTLLSNEIRKRSNQIKQKGSGLMIMRRKEKSEFVESVSLLSKESSLKEGLQVSVRVIEEGTSCGSRRNNERCWHRNINGFLH